MGIRRCVVVALGGRRGGEFHRDREEAATPAYAKRRYIACASERVRKRAMGILVIQPLKVISVGFNYPFFGKQSAFVAPESPNELGLAHCNI